MKPQKVRKHVFTPHLPSKQPRNGHFCVLPPADFLDFGNRRRGEHQLISGFGKIFGCRKSQFCQN